MTDLISKPDEKALQAAADHIFGALESGRPCAPVRDLIGLDPDSAYAVQAINTQRFLAAGRRQVGRKIGLTSPAVQAQLGVDQPDFGTLFADMAFPNGSEIPWERMQQPKAEAEIALIMKRALRSPDVSPDELAAAIDCVVPAIEIVGSRIGGWDIRISDTIADNASSGLYVLGEPRSPLGPLDLAGARMVMHRNGEQVSEGTGADCLGSPLAAALWLARKNAEIGTPLEAGDTILTGALGPMSDVRPGDSFSADISGIGSVSFSVSTA